MPDRRRPNILLLVLAGIAALAVVAIVAGGGGGDDDDGSATAASETRPVRIDGDALPPFTTPQDDPAVGTAAPTMAGEGFDGGTVTAGGGGPAVLIFLAHWCPHCQAEVPVIVDWLADAGEPEGVDLIAIATSIDPARANFPPSEWFEREDWTLPTLVDDESSSAGAAYGLSGFPYYVVLDGEGKVALRLTGELERDELEQLVEVARGS